MYGEWLYVNGPAKLNEKKRGEKEMSVNESRLSPLSSLSMLNRFSLASRSNCSLAFNSAATSSEYGTELNESKSAEG
jgi:hypothetical protein